MSDDGGRMGLLPSCNTNFYLFHFRTSQHLEEHVEDLLLTFNSHCAYLNDGTTAPALEHRFRPIKKEALAMKAGTSTTKFAQITSLNSAPPPISLRFLPLLILHKILTDHWLTISIAIASNYGEGASGKAVSTYFERAKKDPQWNLANTIVENGAGSGGATKAKATPRKKAKKNSSISDDEDTEMFNTPSKTPLNKVASGRITKKATPRSASKKIANYAEPESEDEEDEEMIKGEPEGFEDIQYNRNGNGHSRSNGNGNGHAYAHHVDDSMHTNSYTGAVDDDNENAYYDAEEA
jgi:hypothetical protein